MKFLFLILLPIGAWLVWRAFKPKTKNSDHPVGDKGMTSNPAPIELKLNIGAEDPVEPKKEIQTPFTIDIDHEPREDFSEQEIDKDNWEGSFWEVNEPLPAQATLRIDYEDGAGKKTVRVVDVRQFGSDGYGTLLIGHCRMRNATRTFRTDRIVQCLDEETGEIVDDVHAYLLAKYESSPEYIRDKLLEDEYDSLRILFYVGKADGQLRAAEKKVIFETCQKLANDYRLTENHINDLYNALNLPSIQAFKMAIGRLSKRGPDTIALLIKAAEEIVATQKAVHPSEKEALDYMHKRLRKDGQAD